MSENKNIIIRKCERRGEEWVRWMDMDIVGVLEKGSRVLFRGVTWTIIAVIIR